MIPDFETYSDLISVIDMGINHTFMLAIGMALFMLLWGRAGAGKPLKLPLTLPGLLTLAGAVRVPLLDEVFWYDETFQHRLSTIPLADFWPALLSDVHPPGVYLITRLSVLLFGHSEVALRLPALVAGVLAVYLVYRLANRLYDRNTALLAAALVTVMPAFIAYSAEARHPVFLVVAVLAALVGLVERRSRLFVIAAAPAFFHHVGMFYTVGLALAGLWRWRRIRWLKVGLFTLLLAAPNAGLALLQRSDVEDGFWLILRTPLSFVIDMTSGVNTDIPALAMVSMLAMFVLVLLALDLRELTANRNKQILAGLAIGVPLVVWLVSAFYTPIFLARALLPSAALLLILVARYLITAPRWSYLLLVLAVLPSLVALYDGEKSTQPALFDHCGTVDSVHTLTTNMTIVALYYADAPVVAYPAANNLHQALTDNGFQALDITRRHIDYIDGRVCVVMQLDYNTTSRQRDYADYILSLPDIDVQHDKTSGLVRYVVAVRHG